MPKENPYISDCELFTQEGDAIVSGMLDPYHRWLGISPKDQPPNHYRLLGIDLFEADPEVIRDAAEQRMAHVRTYQLGQYAELSQRILNELAAAKACLLDPQKKGAYDAGLRACQAAPPGKTPPLPSETADEYALQWPVPTSSAPRHAAPEHRVVVPRPAAPVGKLRRKRQPSPLSAAAGVMLVVVVAGFALAWRYVNVQMAATLERAKTAPCRTPCPSPHLLNWRNRKRVRPQPHGRPNSAGGTPQLHHRRPAPGSLKQRRWQSKKSIAPQKLSRPWRKRRLPKARLPGEALTPVQPFRS